MTTTTTSTSHQPPIKISEAVLLWPSSLIAYHATPRDFAEVVTSSGKYDFRFAKSDEGIDWLGDAVYLFPSRSHAIRWAKYGLQLWGWSRGAVVGISVNLGECLDLTQYGATDILVKSYKALNAACAAAEWSMPENTGFKDGSPMDRALDCAVLNTLNNAAKWSERNRHIKYDTILCAFTDGEPPYPGSAFRDKTHLQIAVTNHRCFSDPFLAWSST
jgi:hypothetical protein